MSIDADEHANPGAADVVAFGPFRLFPEARRLERDGARVEIRGRALDILVALVERAGRVVSKSDLLSSVWPGLAVVDGVLRVHVCNLRKALGDGVGGARYITSVAGRGYCFVAPVLRAATREASSSRSEEAASEAPATLKCHHGLPPRLERMAGRDETVRALLAQVAAHRFVTIVGAAGIGKTTVAVSVGRGLLEDFDGVVRFIELGSLTDPGRVAATVASSLGVPVQTDDVLASLGAFLHDKRVLLVLDNCEHVAEAAAALAEHVFLHAPWAHVLATSREALRVEGERVCRLLPLDAPTVEEGLSVESVQTFPAVQVFLERAAASGWSGDLNDDDVPVVAEICERLDGVALALELTASFVGDCGFRGTAAMLGDRLRLLSQHGRRTAPPRHQTLRALIAWSYDRLPDRERVALRRLSVLVGAFSLDAARAVVFDAGVRGESLPEVTNELVAKSLLSSASEGGSRVVYRMLETTRAYALERLVESGELERVSERHAAFFVEHLGSTAGPALGQTSDLANVRAALDWCFSSPARYAVGARLVAAGAQMLLDRGLVRECHDRCRRALEVLGAPDRGSIVEVALQEAFAVCAMFWRGNGDEVRAALLRALEVARALGSFDHEVRLLEHLNVFLVRTGDFRGALAVAQQGAAAAPSAAPHETVRAEWMLGRTHHVCGNQALAEEHCEAGLRLASTLGDGPTVFIGRNHARMTLARTLWLRGRVDRAVALARTVIAELAPTDRPVERCLMLVFYESVFVWRQEWGEAGRAVDVLSEHVERYSLGSYQGLVTALRGELLIKSGRPQEGCKLLETGTRGMNAARTASVATLVAGAWAEGLAATGSLEEAVGAVESGIREAERRGGTYDLPELLRIKGALLASRSEDFGEADETFASAIELAQRQGALAWELRARVTLAQERLHRSGSVAGLRDLAATYAKFTEGLQTPDLQAARALLEQHGESLTSM